MWLLDIQQYQWDNQQGVKPFGSIPDDWKQIYGHFIRALFAISINAQDYFCCRFAENSSGLAKINKNNYILYQ